MDISNSLQKEALKTRTKAKQRRNMTKVEYEALLKYFPAKEELKNTFDRIQLMRLVNSFIKTRHFLKDYKNGNWESNSNESNPLYKKREKIMDLYDSFIFLVDNEGTCIFVSNNVIKYTGLSSEFMIGKSVYSLIYPGDHREFSNLLGSVIQFYESEIFDKMQSPCKNTPILINHNKKFENSTKKSIIVRWKCALTNKGKRVKMRWSEFKPIKLNGIIKRFKLKDGEEYSVFFSVATPFFSLAPSEPILYSNKILTRANFDNHLIYTEECHLNFLGYETDDWVNKSLLNFVHGKDIFTVIESFNDVLQKSHSESKPFRLMLKDKSWIWCLSKLFLVFGKDGKPNHVLSIHEKLSGIERNEYEVSFPNNILSMP